MTSTEKAPPPRCNRAAGAFSRAPDGIAPEDLGLRIGASSGHLMPHFELPPTSAAKGARICSLHAEQPFAEVTNADLRAWLGNPDVGKQKLRATLPSTAY
jgi:hypothetical protein